MMILHFNFSLWTYPSSLFTYIFSLLETKDQAWDCATGNGQVATQLAKEFQVVERYLHQCKNSFLS